MENNPLIELDLKYITPFDILVGKILAEDYFEQTGERFNNASNEAYCCGFGAGIAYVKELDKATPAKLDEFKRMVNDYINGKSAQELQGYFYDQIGHTCKNIYPD